MRLRHLVVVVGLTLTVTAVSQPAWGQQIVDPIPAAIAQGTIAVHLETVATGLLAFFAAGTLMIWRICPARRSH